MPSDFHKPTTPPSQKICMKNAIFKSKILLLMGIFLISGCSFRVMYNYADWVIPWVVDDYFDLTSEQDEFLDEKIKQQLKWHKMSELPAYANFLEALKQKGEDGLTSKELDWMYEQVDQLRKNLVQRLSADTALFLANLNTEQIEYFEAQLAELNLEAQEQQAIPIAEHKAQRAERTVGFLEDWVGTLSEEQKSKIIQWSIALPSSFERRIRLREQRQKEFIALLKNNQSAAVIETHLLKWYWDIEAGYPLDYQKFLKRRNILVREMILKIDRLLTPEQRQHALDRLDEVVSDIQDTLTT